MLKITSAIPLLILWTASVLSASTLSWDTTEAHIELEPDQEEARAVYTVTNNGDTAVRIARIKTSCGCTGSIVDKKIILPGESAEIVGTFNRGRRQGLNRNRLEVYLDSQPEPVATLVMNVQIPQLIGLTPQVVYWSQDSSKTPRSVQIEIDERYIDEIVEIEYDRSRLTVTESTGEPDSEIDSVLTIEPKDYDSLYRGTIIVHGTGPDGRKAEARLHAFIQP